MGLRHLVVRVYLFIASNARRASEGGGVSGNQ